MGIGWLMIECDERAEAGNDGRDDRGRSYEPVTADLQAERETAQCGGIAAIIADSAFRPASRRSSAAGGNASAFHLNPVDIA
jgi:hypothetical protein